MLEMQHWTAETHRIQITPERIGKGACFQVSSERQPLVTMANVDIIYIIHYHH